MIIKKPVLANSCDRTKTARVNPVCGDPYYWFDSVYFREAGLSAVNFDFFVNWETGRIHPDVWIKRIVLGEYEYDPDRIMSIICGFDGEDAVRSVYGFCEKNGFGCKYIMIPEVGTEEWFNPFQKALLFSVTAYMSGDTDKAVRFYNAQEMIELIRSIKKKCRPIGSKGLGYSGSSLEYFLSLPWPSIGYNGDASYPGDADVVLFGSAGFEPAAVIEIKKHSPGSAKKYGSLSDETALLYIGTDRLKYESLRLLCERLGCPLTMLFFPTTDERVIKLQSVIWTDGAAAVTAEEMLPLPQIGLPWSLELFRDEFMSFI